MPPTSAPTESTAPFPDEVSCTFQDDTCDFEIRGEGDFKFTRKSGSEIEAIGVDHSEDPNGMFLYAQADGKETSQVFTYVTSPEFDGAEHEEQCFHFWFYLDGFLVSLSP